MKIGHIRLRVITRSHTFGADIPLGDGLNIIRADNTSGKSTCLLAVLYCLGLERSLGPSLRMPLPYVMRERIQVQRHGGEYEKVLQSFVMLEVSNGVGDVVSIRRDIVGGNDRKLVKTWPGSTIDNCTSSATQKDFFLHDPGAAVREHGFHSYLANFLGWHLPNVPRFDGSECPLYIEALWPMFFVEQKRGWSATQGPLPTFFRIQDLPRRVMEFILQLDIGETRRRQAELRKEIEYLEQRWRDKRTDLIAKNRTIVRVEGLPQMPTAEFSREADVRVSAYFEDKWIDVEDLTTKVQRRREDLESVKPRDVEAAQSEVQAQLKEKEERYVDLSAQNSVLRHEYEVATAEKESLGKRIETLEVDLRRNQDAQKLQLLGSSILGVVADKMCPTCHQPVEKELLPEVGVVAMAVDENIALVRSQLNMYRSIRKANEESLHDLRARYESVRQELSEVRRSIRALKNDLVRPSSAVIWSEVEEVIRLEARLAQWTEVQESVDESIDDLQGLVREWIGLKTELESIQSVKMSAEDTMKVSMLQKSTQELLKLFGFYSFGPNEIELSDDNFRPHVVKRDEDGERVEQNIGFEASASDGIRLKWAYYLALLRVSQQFQTNHVGMVIFDEPGQQQMKELDLASFLVSAAKSKDMNGQIIISTSEDINRVRDSLQEGDARIHDFQEFIIRPIE